MNNEFSELLQEREQCAANMKDAMKRVREADEKLKSAIAKFYKIDDEVMIGYRECLTSPILKCVYAISINDDEHCLACDRELIITDF